MLGPQIVRDETNSEASDVYGVRSSLARTTGRIWKAFDLGWVCNKCSTRSVGNQASGGEVDGGVGVCHDEEQLAIMLPSKRSKNVAGEEAG